MLNEKDYGEKQTTFPETPIQTAGELFPNGTGIELVANQSGRPLLLLLDRRGPRVAPRVKVNRLLYEPLHLSSSVLRALNLPTRWIPYGSTRQLFTEITQAISQVPGLEKIAVEPFTYFVFATWLIEFLPLAPFLWVVAPASVSTAALSYMLRRLCRRALIVPELTMAGLRSLPTGLRPTVLANISGVTRELLRALHASSRPGMFVPNGKSSFADVFCGKVVFANEPVRDPAAAGFPLEIVLAPTLDHVPPINFRDSQRVTADLQAKLLMYRLHNHAKVATPNLELTDLTAPTRDIAYTLAAGIVGDDQLQSQVVRFVTNHDRQIQVDQAALLQSIVLEALLAACHDAGKQTASTTDLTRAVNTILAGRGESLQVSPEVVGWKLRALGINSDFIPGGRMGVQLLDATRGRIHVLAAAYGVRTLRIGVIEGTCPHCTRSTSHATTGSTAAAPRKRRDQAVDE